VKILGAVFSWNTLVRPFALPAWVFSGAFTHRQALHSLAALVFFSWTLGALIAHYLGWDVGLAFVLGYASHLLLDCCTVQGLPLLWPALPDRFRVPAPLRVVTGKPGEAVYAAVLIFLVVSLALSLSTR